MDKMRIESLGKPAPKTRNMRRGDGDRGVLHSCRGDRCHVDGPYIKLLSNPGTRKCLASNVIPMCTRFAIRQNSESVSQADRAKMIDVMIYNWSQTDSTIAWRSETD